LDVGNFERRIPWSIGALGGLSKRKEH
jgi:hypothetical protein